MLHCFGILALAALDRDIIFDLAHPKPIHVGETIAIKLDALPAAGYIWVPSKDGRDNLKLIQVKMEPAPGSRMGGHQTMTFRFKATAPGAAKLNFDYGRPWLLKKGEKPERSSAGVIQIK